MAKKSHHHHTLFLLLKKIAEERARLRPENRRTMQFLCVDCNIFARVMKVCDHDHHVDHRMHFCCKFTQ